MVTTLTRLLIASSTAAMLLTACGKSPTGPSPSGPGSASTSTASSIEINSPAGDPVGGGQRSQFSTTTARFQINQPSPGAILAVVSPNNGGPQWLVYLGAPGEEILEAATYENTEPYIPGHSVRARLSVMGNGRLCEGDGRFTISRMVFDGTTRTSDGNIVPAVSELTVSFENRCRQTPAPGLSGTLVLVRPARLE
jgi:hypothetical protein